MNLGARGRVAALLLLGLVAAAGIGVATHLIARDTVGLSAGQVEPVGRLAPPEAARSPAPTTGRQTVATRTRRVSTARTTGDDDGNRRRRSRRGRSDDSGSGSGSESENSGSGSQSSDSGGSGEDGSGRGRGRGRGRDD